MGIGSKAVVVLAYAHWEGFYNDCVKSYLKFLTALGGRIRDAEWMMLVGALASSFQTLQDKRHSDEARREFVGRLQSIIDCGFDEFRTEVVLSRSNLDFNKLRGNYQILGFEAADLQRFRLKIDYEIVRWRHQVAHGDEPDLSAMDIDKHVDLIAELLLILADHFQSRILQLSSR
jgi:hypothetical protein